MVSRALRSEANSFFLFIWFLVAGRERTREKMLSDRLIFELSSSNFAKLRWACLDFVWCLKIIKRGIRRLAAGREVIGPDLDVLVTTMRHMVEWIEAGDEYLMRRTRLPLPVTDSQRMLLQTFIREAEEMIATIDTIILECDDFVENTFNSNTINLVELTRLITSYYEPQTYFFDFCELFNTAE
jgi:hypothetical protein